MNREELKQVGSELRNKISPGDGSVEQVIPGYDALCDEMEFGAIWSRDGLPLQDRIISSLSSLVLLQQPRKLSQMVAAALDSDLTPRAISEIILQAGLYGGMPLVEDAARCAGDVFAERGLEPSRELLASEDWDALEEEARGYQTELHGRRRDAGHADPSDMFTYELYSIAIHYGYGMIWRRSGLDMRQRLIVALACFATMGSSASKFFSKFALSAADHGMTPAEITEVVVQVVPHVGFPRGLGVLMLLKGLFSLPE